jgi:HK97 family phage portal protein
VNSSIRETERWNPIVGRWEPRAPAPKMALAVQPPAMPALQKQTTLSSVDNRGWHTVFESFPGAFQQNIEINQDKVLSHPIVYACVTLIASDIGKLCLHLAKWDESARIWVETVSSAFSPVLRRPNHYQTRQQFIESWIITKLIYGNAYILKVRDNRQVVTSLYVLDPQRVKPLVSPDGSVFYALNSDDLSRLPFDVPAIPASEVIHDRMECLFHPLVGISPLYAAGLHATQGLKIADNSTKFFDNMARPSGILEAPAQISDVTASRLKAEWEKNYSAGNMGKVAVLGDGLVYKPMSVTAADSQLVEQDDKSAERICSAFHVPAYMVGVGTPPPYNNTNALNQHYYDKCLHKLIDAVENCLTYGIGLDDVTLRVEVDEKDLLRMDAAAKMSTIGEGVKQGIISPNEARREFGYEPVKGGDAPYLQQQQFSLSALHERDQDKPFSKPTAPTPAAQGTPSSNDDALDEESVKAMAESKMYRKLFALQ